MYRVPSASRTTTYFPSMHYMLHPCSCMLPRVPKPMAVTVGNNTTLCELAIILSLSAWYMLHDYILSINALHACSIHALVCSLGTHINITCETGVTLLWEIFAPHICATTSTHVCPLYCLRHVLFSFLLLEISSNFASNNYFFWKLFVFFLLRKLSK